MNNSQFKDFNFKLAVIQVLMYDKAVLQPKFNLYDFVKHYEARKIDIEAEGYEVIPEVQQYFEALEIPSDLLNLVEEIYQDGGDDIYGNVLRFWDGEDDFFNITSIDDLKLLPNLKKITLFYDDEEKMVDEFAACGIEAEYL
jgi:hypothetical protein